MNGQADNQAIRSDEPTSRCPVCGGNLTYSAAELGLRCPVCARKVELPAGGPLWHPYGTGEDLPGRVTHKYIHCSTCGKTGLHSMEEQVVRCGFCDSAHIEEEFDAQGPVPDGICLFSLESDSVETRVRDWMGGKWELPDDALQRGQFAPPRGVYAPVWLFCTAATFTYAGRYGIDYTSQDGDGNHSTHTEWHAFSNQVQHNITLEPAAASDQYPISDLLPYRFGEAVRFHPEYCLGHPAETHNIKQASGWAAVREKITTRIKDTVLATTKRNHRADKVELKRFEPSYADVTYSQCYVPVWVSEFSYEDETYTAYVNGQTGTVVGDYPISAKKVATRKRNTAIGTVAFFIAAIYLIVRFLL